MQRRNFILGGTALATAGLARAAFPERPVKLILGFPPGTSVDLVARSWGQKLGELLGQGVVVDNRTGAGGQIAAQAVARSAPDGYTLLLGEVGAIAIAPAAFSKLPYDPARELVGLCQVVSADFVFVAPTSLPVQTLPEYVAWARARGDKLNFATLGAGSPVHFGGELFAQAAGFPVESVHFRAANDAVAALAGADVHGGFASTAVAKSLVATGRIRALATTAAQRTPLFPQLPTFAESGFPQVAFTSWFALFVPSGTSEPVRAAVSRAALAALAVPEVQARLQDAGFTVVAADAAQTQQMLKSEAQRWAQVVKASGFKGD
ncbi:MAG TPA: tripartite tricarboxylate transporter substrate-binding protein [Ramlibacter sp.]|nr:tripartite tricarboxylate transporter substrate-binding protein [Ramlibacter sp.]